MLAHYSKGMAFRDNLVPTPTVDRNGKATTVYRRDNTSMNAAKPIPAPMPLSPDAREKLILRTSDELVAGNLIAKETKLAVRRNIYSYSNEMLHTIRIAISNDMSENKGMNGSAGKIRSKIAAGDSEESINEAIFFYPLLAHRGIAVTSHVVDALHKFPQLPASADYSREDHRTVTQCTALIRVIDKLSPLHGALNSNWTIEDQRLTELVLANPERGEKIASFIEARESADPDLIEAMLTSEAPALNDGLL